MVYVHTILRDVAGLFKVGRLVAYGESAETLLDELIARTPGVVAQVQAELPGDFSQRVADKVLGGLLASARSLGQSGG